MRAHFLSVRHEASAAVGHAAVDHQAAADRFGLRHPITTKLGEIYLDLLDGRGDLKQHSARMKELGNQIGQRPRWMLAQRGGNPSRYTASSTSALARLAECSLGETGLSLHGDGRLRAHPLLRLDLHRSAVLGEAELKELRLKWKPLYKKYQSRHAALRKQQQAEEDEWRERMRRGGARGDQVDGQDEGKNEWADRYFDLVATMREQHLLADYTEEREQQPLAEPPRLLAEACALYEVVIEHASHATHDTMDPTYYTSFAWNMAGDLLLYVLKARRSRQTDPSRALFTSVS